MPYASSVQAVFDSGALDRAGAAAGSATTLPPSCYVDPAWYEFEREAIFSHEWLCLGRVEQVPVAGDYFTVTIADEPLIVVRGRDDQIRVMSGVCRHRAMIITAPAQVTPEHWTDEPGESSGNAGRSFRCPYHFWTYDLTGQLIGAPAMQRTEGFDKEQICLPNLAVEIWNGFIFANFDRQAEPLTPRLAAFESVAVNWNVKGMRPTEPATVRGLRWNWKVMHENFVDFYHSDRLHARIDAVSPSDGLIERPFADEDAVVVALAHTTVPDFGFNPTFKALFPVIETLTEAERSLTLFGIVPPTFALGFNSDSAFYLIVTPTGPQTIDVSVSGLYPEPAFEHPLFNELKAVADLGVELFLNQDFPANAAVQKGLRSRFAPQGLLSWQESAINHLNRWAVRRYRRQWESAAPA